MELIIFRQLTLCVPQFVGGPLAPWGPRLKPANGKSGPGCPTPQALSHKGIRSSQQKAATHNVRQSRFVGLTE